MQTTPDLNRHEKPIAAIATASGPAGVAIVRVSGEGALDLLPRLTDSPLPDPAQRRHTHARIHHPDTRESLDDVLILTFRAPHSYTGEDAFEIQCHGGARTPHRILNAILAAGARPAQPGEFTRRAFLNGRLDLTQAEAVADLIHAQSDRAAQAARAQLDGALGRRIASAYDTLADWAADIEHALDFEDGELPADFHPTLLQRAKDLSALLRPLLDTRRAGHLLREGALAVICGKPNAGKSTLFNTLLGRRRAIVNAQAGTTRDALEEHLTINGHLLRLTDTAGLRDALCDIEREGIALAHDLINRADIILYILDASVPLDPAERAHIAALPAERLLIIQNKTDLLPADTAPLFPNALPLSLRDTAAINHAIPLLHAALQNLLDAQAPALSETTVAERHYQELETACAQLDAAQTVLSAGPDNLVPAAEHARDAAEALGRIIGRTYSDDLLDRVFSRFCVGK